MARTVALLLDVARAGDAVSEPVPAELAPAPPESGWAEDGRPFYIDHGTQARPPPGPLCLGAPPPRGAVRCCLAALGPYIRVVWGTSGGAGLRWWRRCRTDDALGATTARAAARATGVRRATQLRRAAPAGPPEA